MNQDSHRRPHTLFLLNGIFSKWYEKYKGNSSGLISNLHSNSQSRHEKTAFLTYGQGKYTYARYAFPLLLVDKESTYHLQLFSTSMSNDMRCGKTLAHWFYKVSSDIYGGVTPTLDEIQTDSHMVHLFVGIIFVHNTGLHYKKLKHILSAYVLRCYDAFLGIILKEPSGKYKDPSHQPFAKILSPYFLN